MEPVIEAVKLSKTYSNGHVGLRELSLRVLPGEVYCLLGANGAGKTTTMNCLLGFLPPTSGQALIGGLDVVTHPLESKRKLAYIPEQVALYGHLSGLENLLYMTRLGGMSYSKAELSEFLVRCGLTSKQLSRPASAYSKGMRQKVAIALARARKAEALLLDEPTSGLDPKASYEFSHFILEMAASGAAVLMATHDLFRVKEMDARVGIMREGRLLQEAHSSEMGHSELEQVYLEHMRDAPR